MNPNESLEQQERLLLQIDQSTEIDERVELRLALAQERQRLGQWFATGGYTPRWERWPVASVYWRREKR